MERLFCVIGFLCLAVSTNGMTAELKSVDDFATMNDDKARSVALFEEIGKVLQHPRCLNCHPVGNQPLQGEKMARHNPPVHRGPGNVGVAGMECNTCHQAVNVEVTGQSEDVQSIPGHPKWHLAPPEMAWVGKSLGEICLQLKDKKRNGNKTMPQMIHHMAKDTLVGWGWEPGEGREPVPGTQVGFGKLFKAWVDSGAHCPKV